MRLPDLIRRDRRRTPDDDSRRARERTTRTVELRRTLRIGSVLVGVVLLATGIAFALRRRR